MRLNDLKPAPGSRSEARRVGRGHAAGQGKTCGRGHKGQRARAGGYHKVGFEGGQMPLQRRLPKVGFTSHKAAFSAELRLSELATLDAELVDMDSLKRAGLVPKRAQRVKLIATGKLDKAVTVQGIAVTKGARAAVEAAGGTVQD
ncbi:MAG: 50S ribosomal protein L15, partial [Gammaproteobacteria bacterium]|nr:50S ribosomal protein L15 [Gammaproteobacteria bacterium]